jgi:hypothetical protein
VPAAAGSDRARSRSRASSFIRRPPGFSVVLASCP